MDPLPRREDVTLANALGPPCRGPAEVGKAATARAAQVSDGSVRGFEEVSRYSTPDLGYIVQIELAQARLAVSWRKERYLSVEKTKRLKTLLRFVVCEEDHLEADCITCHLPIEAGQEVVADDVELCYATCST
jgi:hypothetical protein